MPDSCLWLLADVDLRTTFGFGDLWPALLVVVVPLALAVLTQAWAKDRPRRRAAIHRMAWWPVPLLALVIILVATTQVGAIPENLDLLPIVLAVALAYLAGAMLLSRILARVAHLPTGAGRTLAFSLGTRNSFLVLPFALTLPHGWEIAAIVVVVQSLVELLGMVVALWFVPRVLFRSTRPPRGASPPR